MSWINGLGQELTDCASPELLRSLIAIHHSDFPCPGKLPPNLVRRAHPNPAPPVTPNNKEFSHIPDLDIS
jgi:hypothetical protein